MNSLFPVMIGGAIGAGARHLAGQAMLARLGPGFPWWTLSINIAGSLAMGLLIGFLARSGGSETVRLFVGVGILGGFTTFSAFALENVNLFSKQLSVTALLYTALSVFAGILLCRLGIYITT